jgi:hypothetical protein
MKKCIHKILFLTSIIVMSAWCNVNAQVCEWRLVNPSFSGANPDGGGPATGSVTFTVQIHTVSGTINNVNDISLGFSYQSAAAMIPTTPAGPGCTIVSNPANVTVSPAFVTAGFAYGTVNQCGVFSQTTGGQTFDMRAVGTLDGTDINITTTWMDVFTVTLWTLGSNPPEGGYVVINSGFGGTPGAFSTYEVSDDLANGYVVNSLTFTTPLAIGSGVLPVLFTKFDAACTNNGALVKWSTGSEFNSDYFELQRSTNGNNWTSVATIKAAGNSSTTHTYQQLDLNGGAVYYRIKQVDLDGHPVYTSIIRTNCERKSIDMVI